MPQIDEIRIQQLLYPENAAPLERPDATPTRQYLSGTRTKEKAQLDHK
jgi:hypothetical protein